MAKEEYEPGSSVLLSDADLGKVEIKVGPLTGALGAVFPAADVDLKVVKVWYQNLNGWFSYFSDKAFQPVTLAKGVRKQIFVTVRTTLREMS